MSRQKRELKRSHSETNNDEKVLSDILNNQSIFTVKYESIKHYVSSRLVDYVNYNFGILLDLIEYNEKTMENSFVQLDNVLKMKHIDLSTKIQDRNTVDMPYAVDFILDICGEFIDDKFMKVELSKITDTRAHFKVNIKLDKKKEYERYPRLMTEHFRDYTGDGPFDEDVETLFEESKLFNQLKTFSEVVNYTIHLINTIQNLYKDLCKAHISLKL